MYEVRGGGKVQCIRLRQAYAVTGNVQFIRRRSLRSFGGASNLQSILKSGSCRLPMSVGYKHGSEWTGGPRVTSEFGIRFAPILHQCFTKNSPISPQFWLILHKKLTDIASILANFAPILHQTCTNFARMSEKDLHLEQISDHLSLEGLIEMPEFWNEKAHRVKGYWVALKGLKSLI